MLYKKVHRQHLREFRKGRKFKYDYHVHEVTKEPYIYGGSIWISRIIEYNKKSSSLWLFNIAGRNPGRWWNVTWIS